MDRHDTSETAPLLKEEVKREVDQSLSQGTETNIQESKSRIAEVESSPKDRGRDEDEDTSDEKPGCARLDCNAHKTVYRYVLMACLCLIGVGDYFSYDNPAALQGHMLDDLDLSETQYMGLYSAVGWAATGSNLLGGFLIDRVFGMRLGIIVFALLLTLAQGLFAGSTMLRNYWLMYVSRIIYGIVRAPMSIATDNLTVKWFKSRELNMVMGLRTSLPRAASVINMNVMEPIYSYFRSMGIDRIDLGLSFLVGSGVCFLSFLSALIAGYIDYQSGRHVTDTTATQPTKDNERSVQISDIKEFPVSYWLLNILVNIYYIAIFPFVGLGLVYYETKYKVDPQIAGNLNGLVYLLGAIFMPIFGLVIDKVGKNMLWLLASIVLSVASHVLFAFTFINPYIPTTMLGLGYALFTTTAWPMIAHMVDLRMLGTAFGIMNAVSGLTLAAATYLAGYIVDTVGYLVLELYFIFCVTVALILAVVLFLIDSTKDQGGKSSKLASDQQIKV